MRWIIVVSAILLAGVTVLWALGASSPKADFVFANGAELRSLDPQRISWMEDMRIAECLFESLLKYRMSDLKLEPVAAESYDISPDQLTYTFHIRPNAKWSNGDPLLASDFVYAWRRAILPDSAADYTELFFCIEGVPEFFEFRSNQLKEFSKKETRTGDAQSLWRDAQKQFEKTVAIHATDAKTLVVKLHQPTPFFLDLCAFITLAPVHEKSVEAQVMLDPESGRRIQDPLWTSPGKVITNGPYILAMRRFKRDILLTANEHYWNRAAMQNSSILQPVISDTMTAMLAYSRGEVDWLPDIPSNSPVAADLLDDKKNGRRSDVHLQEVAGSYFYNFNCNPTFNDGSKNPLADARVRRALSLGIDRETIVTKVARLGQPVAKTFIPPSALPGYNPPVEEGATFNPTEAKRLLKEAGFPDGKGLDGLSILYNTEGAHADLAQQIKRSWEENLGVVVSLSGVEKNVFGQRLRDHDFAITRASWFGDYRDPTTFLDKFISTNGNNDTNYQNSQFDDLMKQARDELNVQKRFEILRSAEALMLADSPIAPIYHYTLLQVFDADRVTGLRENPWNFRRLEYVAVDRKRASQK